MSEKDFNTSNVVIKQKERLKAAELIGISIHLMLLLN